MATDILKDLSTADRVRLADKEATALQRLQHGRLGTDQQVIIIKRWGLDTDEGLEEYKKFLQRNLSGMQSEIIAAKIKLAWTMLKNPIAALIYLTSHHKD